MNCINGNEYAVEVRIEKNIDKPESKSKIQVQSQIEKGKKNLDSGLSLKSNGPPTPPLTFGNPESSSVYRRSPNSINHSKFQIPWLVPVDSSLVFK